MALGGILLLAAGLARGAPAAGEEVGAWPLRLSPAPLQVAFYEPSVETFVGEWLTGRAAVAVTRAEEEPVFGALWFKLKVRIDEPLRQATVLACEVVESRFPADLPVDDQRLAELVEQRLPGTRLDLDALLASLARAEAEAAAAVAGQDAVPEIVWVPYPVSVVRTDGVPRLQEVADLPGLLQVVNTDALIVVHGGRWYLWLEDAWLVATDFYGEWTLAADLPEVLLQLTPDGEVAGPAGEPPRVLAADRPLEVIETAGSPALTVIPGTSLLVVANTDADLFFDIGSQRYYVLLAGRWFASESLRQGPWAAVDAEQLPSSFAELPADDAKGGVLAHVPGTEVARQAVLEAQTPTVQSVSREATATVVVDYRGEPSFARVGTLDLHYAVNSPYSVLRVGASFYLCFEGVWYWSGSAHGPWRVSVGVPSVVYAIPPHYPVYPVTYVRVYDWTPSSVYVGYTSGYYGWHVGYSRRGLIFGFSYYDPFWHWPVAAYCPPRPIYRHRPVVYHRVAFRGYHYSPSTWVRRPRAVVAVSGGHRRPVVARSQWRSPSHYASGGHGRGMAGGDRVRPVAGGVADGRRSVPSGAGREGPTPVGRSTSRSASGGSSGFSEWRNRQAPAVRDGDRGVAPAVGGGDRPVADSVRSRVAGTGLGAGAPSGGAGPVVGRREALGNRAERAEREEGVERVERVNNRPELPELPARAVGAAERRVDSSGVRISSRLPGTDAERVERMNNRPELPELPGRAVGAAERRVDASGVRIFSRSPGKAEGRVVNGGAQGMAPPVANVPAKPTVGDRSARPLPEVPAIRRAPSVAPSVAPVSREPSKLLSVPAASARNWPATGADGPRVGGGGVAARPATVPTSQVAPAKERQMGVERFSGQRLQVPALPVVPSGPSVPSGPGTGKVGGSGGRIDMPSMAIPKAGQVLQGGERVPSGFGGQRPSPGLPSMGTRHQPVTPAIESAPRSGMGQLSQPSGSRSGGGLPAVKGGASPTSSRPAGRGRGFGR